MPMEKRSPRATNPGESAEIANTKNHTLPTAATSKPTTEDAQRDRVVFLKQMRERRSKW